MDCLLRIMLGKLPVHRTHPSWLFLPLNRFGFRFHRYQPPFLCLCLYYNAYSPVCQAFFKNYCMLFPILFFSLQIYRERHQFSIDESPQKRYNRSTQNGAIHSSVQPVCRVFPAAFGLFPSAADHTATFVNHQEAYYQAHWVFPFSPKEEQHERRKTK